MGRTHTKVMTALAIGALIVGSGVAGAAPTPTPTLPALSVTPSPASPGDTVTITGKECGAGKAAAAEAPKTVPDPEAIVRVADWDPVTTKVPESGAWSVTVKVPAGTAAGTYPVKATCDLYVSSADYPAASLKVAAAEPTGPTVTTDSDTVAAGGKVTVDVEGFDSDEDLKVTLHSDPVELGGMTADAAGAASASFTIPGDVPAGVHRLEVLGLVSKKVANASITVTEAVPDDPATDNGGTPTGNTGNTGNTGTTTGDNLAFTGSDAIGLGVAGLMATLAGVGILVLRRRRIA